MIKVGPGRLGGKLVLTPEGSNCPTGIEEIPIRVPMSVKVGDLVMWTRFGEIQGQLYEKGRPFEIDGEEVVLVAEGDLLAVVE